MKKSTRTISGVTPVAVMTRPMPCPGRCIYCPTYRETPQSYTPESPAVLRAIKCDYDAARQVELRIQTLAGMGHPVDKVELIIMGGTFLSAPADYQYSFIKGCYDALNGRLSASLEEAVAANETAKRRCVGLCIETRPDCCGPEEIRRMLQFGATRVELGVQMLDDEIYNRVSRGHLVEDVIRATALLKNHGFKVHYHWMPGLPGSSPEKDLALSHKLFTEESLRPDGLKIYPTMVVSGTELEKLYRQGMYRPYPDEVMIGLIADIKALVPGYVRISRVLRDIPAKYIVGGLKDSLRDRVRELMEQQGKECCCIRCREYGHRTRLGRNTGQPQLKRLDYRASGGDEIFLSFEDEFETLFGLLRLRVQPSPPRVLPGESGKTAIIRELHVYGPEVPIGEKGDSAVQHRGLGHQLLAQAECIACKEAGVRKIFVLSGVGAREYYRGFGYRLKDGYMVKDLG